MESVFVIGATGETGSRLVEQLLSRGNNVHALCRRSDQHTRLQQIGVKPHMGDLVTATVESLAMQMAGCDIVIFTAGANGGGDELTTAIDGRGVELASMAAKKAGIRRFILVSAFPDAWREKRMPPDFEHYMFIKRQADVFLSATDMDWIIVRPGTLTSSAGTGLVRAGVAIPYGDISRDDLAGFICELINSPDIKRIIIELTNGKDTFRKAIVSVTGFQKH